MSKDLVIQSPALDKTMIEQVAAIAESGGVRWTTKTVARLLDVPAQAEQIRRIAQWCNEHSADHALVDAHARLEDCRVLVMDMDSTLINIECIDEIAAFAGLKAEVSAITERAMRGEIKEFSDSLRLRVGYLEGLDADVLASVYEQKLALNPGAEALIAAAQQRNIKTLLVSGGFTFFTERLKKRLNLDAAHANQLEIGPDNRLTGRVLGKIIDAQGKADLLTQFASENNARSDQIIAVGDGANDLKMMGIAGYSVAYRAKPVVQSQARFALNYSPLDAILHWFSDT